MKKTLLIGGKKYSFEISRGQDSYQVALEGENFTFERPFKICSARDRVAGKIHLHLPFGRFWVSEDEGARGQDTQAVQEGHCSPMPAKVSKILAQSGQAVKQGDPLVILEAMKMEYTINAQRDGAVAAIHCSAGEQVDAGDCLLELEDVQDA